MWIDDFEISLAPMEGVTDLSMRLFLFLTSGIDRMTTPFLRATATYPHRDLPQNWLGERAFSRTSYQVVGQVMASRPEDFLRAAKLLPAGTLVELNCGCPAPKAVGRGAGSQLLTDCRHFGLFIRELCDQLPAKTLRVKMRTGFTDSGNFGALIDELRDLPLNRLTIHGRTRAQRYTGRADWHFIEHAAMHLPYPVVGSGDIVDHATWLERRAQAPSVTRHLIGRGFLTNPWLALMLRGDCPLITPELLTLSVHAFGHLHHLYSNSWSTLLELESAGHFAYPIGTDVERWRQLVATLAKANPAPSTWSRCVLGRMKMLLGYLGKGIGSVHVNTQALRQSTVPNFLHAMTH